MIRRVARVNIGICRLLELVNSHVIPPHVRPTHHTFTLTTKYDMAPKARLDIAHNRCQACHIHFRSVPKHVVKLSVQAVVF